MTREARRTCGVIRKGISAFSPAFKKQEFIQDFAANLNINVKVLQPFFKKRDWKGLVQKLITEVPREGGDEMFDI